MDRDARSSGIGLAYMSTALFRVSSRGDENPFGLFARGIANRRVLLGWVQPLTCSQILGEELPL